MTWILIVLGSVLGLVALVFVVGSFLPERYGARGFVDVSESAEELWPKLLDYRAHPMAAKMAKDIEAYLAQIVGVGQARVQWE